MVESVDNEDDRTSPESDADLGLGQFESAVDDEGISLDELSRAYAKLVETGKDPYEPAVDKPERPIEIVPPEDAVADPNCDLCPRSILEAILFVGHPQNEPIQADDVARLMRGVPASEIEVLVQDLNEGYQAGGHPFHVVSIGTGYRLELRDEFTYLRNVFYGRVRAARLSQAAIDVLAIVAYQQGLTRESVDRLRGRPSGALLSQLVRRQLLRVERPEKKPRTPRYFTTNRFLELFGLASLDELPRHPDTD